MNVNSAFRVIVRNQLAVLAVIIIIISTFFIASSFTHPSKSNLFVKQVNLTIREIGHHLLLQAGDPTSRVLPVRETSEGVFLLEFENELVFQPDTLVVLTRRFLEKTNLTDYTVTVHECYKPEIIYGFQISSENSSIEPCRGRRQPKGCYTIEIAFATFNDASMDYGLALIISGFLFLFSVVLMVKHSGRKTSGRSKVGNEMLSMNSINTALPTLGKLALDVHNQKLLWGDEIIALTDKEFKILQLLKTNFGQLTSREDLIQEVWANEGVITGRSLDMFVSKLRKKLSADPDVRITNIHGKGYKLEVIRD